jgi:hypothetical protein
MQLRKPTSHTHYTNHAYIEQPFPFELTDTRNLFNNQCTTSATQIRHIHGGCICIIGAQY